MISRDSGAHAIAQSFCATGGQAVSVLETLGFASPPRGGFAFTKSRLCFSAAGLSQGDPLALRHHLAMGMPFRSYVIELSTGTDSRNYRNSTVVSRLGSHRSVHRDPAHNRSGKAAISPAGMWDLPNDCRPRMHREGLERPRASEPKRWLRIRARAPGRPRSMAPEPESAVPL